MRLLIVVCISLLSACAHVVSPDGGGKDLTPPEVLATNPPNESTQFEAQKVTLLFDEYIQLKDAFNQVIVSPPLKEAPTFKVKGKKLEISWTDTLLEGTTYTINFGESISDITENNPLNNYVYAFSTGDEIDSLVIQGRVTEMYDGKTPKGTYILLHRNLEDSAFMNQKPIYFTKAQENGQFSIGHIKAGDYRIYALVDQNFNYLYDLPNEKIAFLDDLISIDSTNKPLELHLFQEKPSRTFIKQVSYLKQMQWLVTFTEPIDTLQLIPEDEANWEHLLPSSDTLLLWLKTFSADTVHLRLQNSRLDTLLMLPLDTVAAASISSVNTWLNKPAETNNARARVTYQHLHQPIALQFRHPIREIQTNLVQLTADSVQVVDHRIEVDAKDPRNVLIWTNWLPDTPYTLQVNPGAFTDLAGRTTDSIWYTFQTRKPTDYGSIDLHLEYAGTHQLVIELNRKSGELIERLNAYSMTDSADLVFSNLLPDTYTIRIIEDKNANQKWDTGSFITQRQPEPVFTYPAEIKVKPMWNYRIKYIIKG